MERTFKLKDTSPETMETLRQANSFARMAQDENRPLVERRVYLKMAEDRYREVYVEVLVEVHPNPIGDTGTYEVALRA